MKKNLVKDRIRPDLKDLGRASMSLVDFLLCGYHGFRTIYGLGTILLVPKKIGGTKKKKEKKK